MLEVNHRLQRLKARARERLLSEEGVHHRRQRAIEPEAVFGQVKSNNRFTRLHLRTLAKAEVDYGLAAVAQTDLLDHLTAFFTQRAAGFQLAA